jgi:hypothetical protein
MAQWFSAATMRLCRFEKNRLGIVRCDRVIDVMSVLDRLPSYRYPPPLHDPLIAALDSLRQAIEHEVRDKSGIPYTDVALAGPIANSGKVSAALVNYKNHLDEARSPSAPVKTAVPIH